MADLSRQEVIKLIAVTERVNLIGVDLSGVDLSKLSFVKAKLEGANLKMVRDYNIK